MKNTHHKKNISSLLKETNIHLQQGFIFKSEGR